MEKRRLGRGLEGMLGVAEGAPATQAEVPIMEIEQNPYQPRKSFDPDDLASLSRQRYVSPLDIAVVYTGMGERDPAFEWLEKAFQVARAISRPSMIQAAVA